MLSQELFDRQVEHMILTRRYSESARVLIERESARHRSSLAKLLRRDLRHNNPELVRAVTAHVKELYGLSRSSVEDFLGAEIDFQTNSLKRSVRGFYRVEKPSREEVNRILRREPLKLAFNDKAHGTLQTAFQSMGDKQLTAVQRKIRNGIADGLSQTDIINDVMKSTKLTENQAKTLVTTHITRAEQLVKEQMYDRNSGVINGFVFSAILDSKTSKLCSSYDGLFQSRENIRVRPPLHWNCRSTLVPVLKSREAMLESQDKRINREALSKLAPSELPGGLPLKESFSEWLSRQTHQTKLKYLDSEEKIALFEKGTLDLTEFFTAKGNPISLAALRVRDNLLTWYSPTRQIKTDPSRVFLDVSRPFQIVQSKKIQDNLRDLIIADASNAGQPLSLTDFRGTTLAGKRGVRQRANNVFDPRNQSFDPFTGEVKSSLHYDPDFTLFQERIDYMKNSKLLSVKQKEFIESFAESFDDRISVNQKTAVVENLRLIFERYEKDKVPWDDFVKVMRTEQNYSVTNVSRLLDRRSRARADLFLSYRGDPTEPSVMIMGEKATLKELHDSKLSTQRFINNWETEFGRAKARSMFYNLKAPWKAYFFPPAQKPKGLSEKLKDSFYKRSIRKVFYRNDPVAYFTRFGKTPDKWTKIVKEHVKDKVKDGIPYYKFLEKLSEEGVKNFLVRSAREQYRDIVDLEFLLGGRKKTLADTIISKAEKGTKAEAAINVLSSSMTTIAEGRMTDYDGLAIAVGKNLHQKWPGASAYMGASLSDYHQEGSRLLEHFRKEGLIRVNSRGVTRRATIDLDTGRQSGNWKDTVSREVEILDKDMLALQAANRRFELANRIGIEQERNKLYVVAGQKNYLDARGNDTGIPVITRSAYEKFDAKQLDKDFANMLNHTMSLEYEVDPVFASFMDDVVRFKDNRGKAEYYDNINAFREEIIRRGDQGYGLMETVRYYNSSGKKFTVPARIDGRGRVYYNG